MYKADNELDEIPNSFDTDAFVKKYFKITQTCTKNQSVSQANNKVTINYESTCFAPTYRAISSADKKINGASFEAGGLRLVGDKIETYMLADGTVMTIRQFNPPVLVRPGQIIQQEGLVLPRVIFDVNGAKGRNIAG